MDNEIELARLAKEAFDSHRYESCLSSLNKLQEHRRSDGRVAHNRAVAQYLLSNLTLTDGFKKSLLSVNAQFDRDSENSGVEATIADKAVLYFNQALIHMRLHQYKHATFLLEQLFQVHNTLHTDSLAVEVSLLLIEVCLRTNQLEMASKYIEFLESHYFKSSNGGRGEELSGDGGVESYRSKMYLFKACLSVLTGNIKTCKKELKSLTSISGNSSAAQFLKANIEFLRGNFQKSLKVLGSTQKSPMVTESGECLTAFSLNNIGCIHYQLGKYSLAAHYLRKAIEENDAALNGFPPLDKATPLSGRPLAVLGVNCRHILLYNLGIQQLFSGAPMAAFDSLLEVVQVYHANPRLWLRLAEASVSAHTKVSHDLAAGQVMKSGSVQLVVGSGINRKLVVSPLQQTNKKGSSDTHSQSAAMPAPTLEFAAICLRNALFLVSPEIIPSCSTLPGPTLHENSVLGLRCSILSYLSYVSLGLGDPLSALSYATQLLASPTQPKCLEFLGHIYSAEALVLLDRIPEALHHLNPENNLSDNTFTITSSAGGLASIPGRTSSEDGSRLHRMCLLRF
ncbi:CCR4-NOT transcription complex subunit 10-like isoform X3 [Halichondria panicea]|uniref:CCR4-NOT transcription complex subunit 10-like isoform X3 n=1 Tax=Halichondria panicea TaxID=6063 RepID=UPI00312B9FB9